MSVGGTYLHVIQPVLTFLDPFLPEDGCGSRDVDAGESESSPIITTASGDLLGFGSPCLVRCLDVSFHFGCLGPGGSGPSAREVGCHRASGLGPRKKSRGAREVRSLPSI